MRVPEQQCFQCRGDFVGMTREHASAPERKHWQRRTRALNHFDGANSCAAPSRTAAACRRRGHDADAFISPTSSIRPDEQHPGRAGVRDRIDRARGTPVPTAIQLTIYTARSRPLKRDEAAGYTRIVRATGEDEPGTLNVSSCARALNSKVDSNAYVTNPIDAVSD